MNERKKYEPWNYHILDEIEQAHASRRNLEEYFKKREAEEAARWANLRAVLERNDAPK